MVSLGQDNLVLFGLDLRNFGRLLKLALNQLLFDPSSYLAKRFQPPLWIYADGQWYRCVAGEVSKSDPPQDAGAPSEEANFYGACVREEDVLFKRLRLPSSSEMFLADAIALEVDQSSPFAAEELIFGACIESRDAGLLDLVVAMTTRGAASRALERWRDQLPAGEDVVSAQACAMTDRNRLVEFDEYIEPERNRFYLSRLRDFSMRTAAIALALVLMIAIPAASSSYRARNLADEYAQLRHEAKSIDRAVGALHAKRDIVATISEDVEARLDFAFWLHHIAQSTPDGTRLERMSIQERSVQVLGYSDNAANYLRVLTEQPSYSEVSARSAFVRHSRTGKERFQIDWALVPEGL